MSRQYFVYILTNHFNTVLYTGMTNNLLRRIGEHRSKKNPGFTSRYNVEKLVYFEETNDVYAAIAREKQIKAGSRKKKKALIESINKEWRDLFEDLW